MTNHLTTTPAERLAEMARQGLRQVAEGEDKVIGGWLLYGAALNEGRKLFPEYDKGFGQWLVLHQLDGVNDMDRLAAMWAAGNRETFRHYRKTHPRVRTVRGLHAKWKEDQQPQPAPKLEVPTEDELRVVQKLRSLVDHPSTDPTVRENAQRKLDTYTARFGEPEPEEPTKQLTKKELSARVTKEALKKATKNPMAFDIIDYAIRQTYGSVDGYLETILKKLKTA
jgi:hypothetical protein